VVETLEAAFTPGMSRRSRHPAAIIASLLLVAGILLIGCDGGIAQPSGPTGQASLGASQNPGAASPAGPTPVGETGAWTSIEPATVAPEATLRAARTDTAGVFADTTFILTATGTTPAATLATRLASNPTAPFRVGAGPDARSVTLRPERALAAGQTYRFDLSTPDGATTASWAFQVRGPVHVLSTIPGDTATEVPTTTSIELTFDQDGVAAMSPYFTISPATRGRFERNGRTQIFVPFGLKARTVYTVTVRRGLPGVATGLALGRDLRFRFETSGPPATEPIRIRIGRDVLQASPAERPVIGLEVILPDVEGVTSEPPRSVPVRVYRYPSGDAAIGQLRLLFDQPGFAEWSEPKVSTGGLPRVLSFSARLRMVDNGGIITFPTRLPVGWYLVEVGSTRRSQAILQVTSVTAWVAVLSDRTVVWANDVVTGRPVSRALVRLHGGATLGRTDPTGMLIARTPAALIPPEAIADDKSGASGQPPTAASPILDVRAPNGTSVSVPFDVNDRGGVYRGEWSGYEPATSPGWWSLLSTDRELYRTTDTVAVLGLLRTRVGRTVPPTVELRLVTAANDQVVDPPVIARITVHPDAGGVFSGSLRLTGQGVGSYVLQAVVGGSVARRTTVQVGVIRKPLYELSVELDHRAVIQAPPTTTAAASDEGRIAATISARFFDGRPVPTIPLRVANDYEDSSGTRMVTAPTDAEGQVVFAWSPVRDESAEGEGDVCISISPARTEEGEIQTSSCALVFPSAVTLRAEGTLKGRRLALSGDVHLVDLPAVERQLAAGLAEDTTLRIEGRPVAGTTVTAEITELIPVRHLAGYLYDPITKQVVPQYDYETTRRLIRTVTVRTGADGRFRAALSVPSRKHDYEIVLRTIDQLGRTERHTIYAGPVAPAQDRAAVRFPQFETIVGEREVETSYDVGDAVRLTMTDGIRALPSGGSNRYLYIVARQGLRTAKVTTSSRFVRRFAEGDVPGIFVIGVRFTGRTYAPKAATWADFDPSNRRVDVRLTADRSRYEPGGTATIAIRTTDVRGRPVAASVILRAVDEKLFAMGAAVTYDPLPILYEREPSGILRLTATHQPPGGGTEGEGGAAGGGGDEGLRSDFVDTLAFRQVRTDRQGRATVVLPLSDDLTSWHLSATAVTSTLGAGEGQLLVAVGLPFFVEATIADGYLVADRPTIRLRAYGDGLSAGDPVTFTVSGASLGLAPTRYQGRAFVDTDVPLPPLVVGRHVLTIEASSTRTGRDGRPLSDRLARTVTVVASRLTTTATDWRVLTTGDRLPGGSDLTTYTFSDAGRGRYISLLEELASEGGARIDRAIAQAEARDLLVGTFGRDPAALPSAPYDPNLYQFGTREDDEGNTISAGVSLLPYSGPDPMLAARIAIVAPDRLDADGLRDVLLAIDRLPSTTRELHLAVTAGLASLGVPRLAEIRAAARLPDLTVREQLYVALGAEAAGDDETARSIEGALLRSYGERLGGWARLRTGSSADELVEYTSLCALVAAGLGDPLAPALLDYVRANPARTELHVLEEIGTVERAVQRTPDAAASFAYTLDGRRHVVDLPAGGSFGLDLSAAQRDAIRLETLTGSVGIAASWAATVVPTDLRRDPDLELTRSVTPAGTIPTDSVVVVELRPTFGGTAVDGCYDVVESVPSGLAPMTRSDAWVGDDGTVSPYAVVGQQVRFCADRSTNPRTPLVLRYLARVITPGTYAWEPAVMRFAEAPGGVALVPAGRVGIGSR